MLRLLQNKFAGLFTLIIFFIFSGVVANAQCSGTPTFSSCTDEFFTSIAASGSTGVSSAISVSGITSCPGGYINDFATQGISVYEGSTVTISGTRKSAGTGYTAYLWIYIDWNNAGSFSTTDNVGGVGYYITIPSATSNSWSYPAFTIPSTGVATGTNLRMRVFYQEVTTGTPPCTGGDNYGEAYDFYCYINPACSGTPAAGAVSPASTIICTSGTTPLSLTTAIADPSITYQWSSNSVNTPPGSNIAGATNSTYTPSAAISTTYYWCTATCTTSSLTNISSVGTFSVIPAAAPTVIVTPDGGSNCSGSSGLSMTASGASNYTWSPASGLSTTTGPTVVATPTVATVYSVTGTNSFGCIVTNTVTVNYNTTPGTVAITPGSVNVCIGTATNLLTASLGSAGPTTASSGTISVSIPKNAAATSVNTISGIPAGATITSASVTLTTTTSGAYQSDLIFNLEGPDGGIISLIAGQGIGSADAFTNVIYSSAGTTAISGSQLVAGNSYIANLTTGKGPTGYISTATTWGSLYTIPNGTWTLIGDDTYAANKAIITGWSITLTYTLPTITWSPVTQLYTSTAGTTAYTVGTATNTVYENPLTAGVITYTATANNGGCTSTATVTATVIGAPTAIIGNTSVCFGSTTTLSDAMAGGAWSSGTTSVATIDPVLGTVYGIAPGTTAITYSNGCGAAVTTTVTVVGSPGAISGTLSVCSGAIIILSDVTTGGTWSSSNTGVATVSAGTGNVTGGSGGIAIITYSIGCGTSAITTITVNPLPTAPAAITGTMNACAGSVTPLSDITSGGVWSSTNTSVAVIGSTGGVTGVAAGLTTISYTLTNSCGNTPATTIVTINPLPAPATILGNTSICAGSTNLLTDAAPGGIWSSNNTSVATIGAPGNTAGITPGVATITYTITNGCGTAYTTTSVTVNPLPVIPASITGTTIVCLASTTSLSDVTPGGVWSSVNMSLATIGATGIVSGVALGTTIISYTISNICGVTTATTSLTVSVAPATPAAITGNTAVCGITVLSDAISGGAWSTGNSLIATVDATGTVTGVSISTTTISYTITNSCGSAYTTTMVNILPLPDPAPITGSSLVCVSGTMMLNDVAPGGVWSSGNTLVATVDAAGSVYGVATGSTMISYTITNSCGSGFEAASVTAIILPPVPDSIKGDMVVCADMTLVLSDATPGGIWNSSITGIATISSSGIASGVSGGSTMISYSFTNTCGTVSAMASFTVIPVPDAGTIYGNGNVCPGNTTTLSDSVSGGVWSSSVPSFATVSVTGTVTWVSTGLDNISYSVTNGCGTATAVMEIDDLSESSSICNPSSVATVSNAEGTQLKVFPNPNPGAFTLEVISGNDEPVHVIITNVVGEKVMEFFTATNKENNIKLDRVSGLYFLSAKTTYSANVVQLVISN